MSIELNWQEGEHIPSSPGVVWETEPPPLPPLKREPVIIARSAPAAPRRLRSRVLAWLIGIPVVVLLLAAGTLYWRAHQGQEAAQRDIEATLQTLQEARRDGDRTLIAKLLDPSDPTWQEAQGRALLAEPPTALPAEVRVTEVALQGDYALAEVVEQGAAGQTLRKRVPLRRTDGGWLLTAPDLTLVGEESTRQSTHFTVYYRQVDEPFIADVINAAEGAYVALCSELRCRGTGPKLSLRIWPPGAAEADFAGGVLAVPSPWSVGVDPAGRPAAEFYQQIVRQIGWRLAQIKAPEAAPALWWAVGDWAAAELAGAPLPGDLTFMEHVRNGRQPLPLDLLWRSVAYDNDHTPLTAAQFRQMLTFLQDTYGADAVGRLLEGAPRHLHQIVRRRFGTDIQALEAAWQQWLYGGKVLDSAG